MVKMHGRKFLLRMLSPLLGIASIFFVLISPAFAVDVCRTYSFQGMEAHKGRAEKILPLVKTQDLQKAMVYVEYDKDDGVLYYHSNFISGVDGSGKLLYPTKIKGDPSQKPVFADAARVFLNIIETSPPDDARRRVVQEAFENEATFFVDISVFDTNGMPRVDLTGLKKIHLVNSRSNVSLKSGEIDFLTTAKPPPSLISKVRGCCLWGRPPHRVEEFSTALSKRSINTTSVKVVSLFIDSATDAALKSSSLLRSSRLGGPNNILKSESDVAKIFAQAKGSTVVLLGHVEGSDYVVRTGNNAIQLQVPIERMRAIARENQVSLIDIGCNTAKAIQSEAFGLGVMTKYGSVEAVKSIEKALNSSKNLEEFLTNISSEGLKIVIEPSYLQGQSELKASIYSRVKASAQSASKAVWVKVAQIAATFVK